MAVHHQDQCQTHHCGLRGTSWKSWTLKIIGLDSEGLIIFSYFSRFLLHENTPSNGSSLFCPVKLENLHLGPCVAPTSSWSRSKDLVPERHKEATRRRFFVTARLIHPRPGRFMHQGHSSMAACLKGGATRQNEPGGAMMERWWPLDDNLKRWSKDDQILLLRLSDTFRYFQILSDTFRYFQILSPPIGPSVCKNVCSICAGASFGWGSTENQRLLQAQMVCFCRCPGACSPSPESPVISRHVMPVSGLHTWNVHTIRGFQAVQQSATRLGSAWVAPRICQTPRILRNKHVTVFGLSRNATTIWGSVKNSVYGTVLGNDASYLAEVTLMLARGPRAQSHILQPSIKWYSFFSVFQLTGWNRQNRFPIWGFPIHLWRDWLQFFHTTCRWRLRRVYLSKQESLEV